MNAILRHTDDAMILAGAALIIAGVYLLLGLAVALIVGGAGLLYVGWRIG